MRTMRVKMNNGDAAIINVEAIAFAVRDDGKIKVYFAGDSRYFTIDDGENVESMWKRLTDAMEGTYER